MSEEIAITGISGRFPGCSTIDDLKSALLRGEDLISSDHKRWPHEALNTPSRLGLLPNLRDFDSTFFGINPKQASAMDPRNSKLLEAVFEAIVDSGTNPQELRGSNTGVFLATTTTIAHSNHEKILTKSSALIANSISFYFDLKGPSYAVDTGCSSGLYALNQAVDSIENGNCDRAIICGSHVNSNANESVEFSNLGVLDPEGKCKTFDRNRNGYVKSDGVVAMVVQKNRNHRRIYATIAGIGCNVDGFKSAGMNHPSNLMQRDLFEKIYKRWNIDPDQVTYLEAHGTGTIVGDAEETRAISDFFLKKSNKRSRPLLVGSIKSNLGHTESASGLVSLVKVLIVAQTGVIPANLHFNNPDFRIPGLKEGTLKVVDQNTKFEGGLMAVNSFGFGGANGHVVLRPCTVKKVVRNDLSHRLVLISGRTEEAVQELINKTIEHKENDEFLSLIDGIFKTPIENHNYRGYVILSDNPKWEIVKRPSQKRPIWFVYSGMGSQWIGMGRDLVKIPLFKETMKKCAAAVRPYGLDLEKIITDESEAIYDNVINCFTSITAMSVCLTKILLDLGIKPDGIIGHSMGEIACAYADGLITEEQATLVAYGRGLATVDAQLIPGLMASVGLSVDECEKLLPEDIFVACDNSKDNVTISGPKKAIEDFTQKLTQDGIFNKIVDTANVAFHSKYIESAGPKLLEFLKNILPEPKLRSKRWLPSAINEKEWNNDNNKLSKYTSAEYHCYNYLHRVQFRQVLEKIPNNAVAIELSPHGLLQPILKRNLNRTIDTISASYSNEEVENNMVYFLSSIGKLYAFGNEVNNSPLLNGHSMKYPVSCSTPSLSSCIKWNHSLNKLDLELYDPQKCFGERYVIDINEREYKFLKGHVVNGQIIFPGAGYLVLVWKSFSKFIGKATRKSPVTMQNVKFFRTTHLSRDKPSTLIVNLFTSTGEFDVSENGTRLASGIISAIENNNLETLQLITPDQQDYDGEVDAEDFYKILSLRGYDYYGDFRGALSVSIDGEHGKFQWNQNWIAFIDTIFQHIAYAERDGLFLPTEIDEIIIKPNAKHDSNRDEFPLKFDRKLHTAQCEGVEVKSLKGVNVINRHNEDLDPTLMKYQFVADTTLVENLGLDPYTFSLAIAIQIVIENSDLDLRIGEIANENSMGIEILQAVMAKPSLKRTKFTKIGSISEDGIEGQFDFLIALNSGNKKDVIVSDCLKRSKFVFGNFENYDKSYFDLLGAEIIYKHESKAGVYVLFRSSSELPEDYKVIYASSSNFSWIEDLKLAIGKCTSTKSRIYLINKDSISGIVGFFNCVRMEQSCKNLRIFYIKDENMEQFSLKSKFYQTQIRKDLTINIYQDNQWGTYRLLLQEPLTHHDSNQPIINPNKCYIIIGGLGGCGLELAHWLIQKGVTKLILNSKGPPYTGYQKYCLNKWKNSGITVVTDTHDTTEIYGAQSLLNSSLKLNKIGGIFNLSLVLNDELLVNQSAESFKAVVAPKLFSSQTFDFLSRKMHLNLDYFVVFSSMVASLGNATQSNYGFANSSVEMLCENRRRDNLHALAIQWGPIGDVGFVARLKTKVKFLEAVPQGITSCLDTMEQFLQQPQAIVASCVFNNSEEIHASSTKSLVDKIARLFGIKDSRDLDDSKILLNWGLDSILTFEIRHMLSKDYNVELSDHEIRHLSVQKLREIEKLSQI